MIYGLVDPRDGQVHYIGQTRNLAGRLANHRRAPELNDGSRRTEWLKSLVADGLSATILIIEAVDTLEAARAAEQRWIREGEAKGWPLTNLQHVQAPIEVKRRFCLLCTILADGSACAEHYRPSAESAQ